MLRFLAGLAAVLLVSVHFATAGTVLYTTGATPLPSPEGDRSRIYGYCLRRDGAICAKPFEEQLTGGDFPRRFQVASDVLFVAENDRVEAYQIGPKGGLTKRLAAPEPITNMQPADLALSADKTTLYVPRRSRSQIVSYKIGPQGFILPPGSDSTNDYDSCVHRRTVGRDAFDPQRWEAVAVRGNRLYVSRAGFDGGIRIYPLDPDGRLPGPRDQPADQPTQQCRPDAEGFAEPIERRELTERRRLGGPRTFTLGDNALFVQRTGERRLLRFELFPDGDNQGLFKRCTDYPAGTKPRKCKEDTADEKDERVLPIQTTRESVLYAELIMQNSAILGSVFARGRIDSFLLRGDGSLPKRPTRSTSENFVASPVHIRTFTQDGTTTLFVPGGDLDRVSAYRLRPDGTLASNRPFSETDKIDGSFPNEVIVHTTPEDCTCPE
jgi:hypothetical protein